MYARQPAHDAPHLELVASPQTDGELERVKALLGDVDYTYIYPAKHSKQYAFQCETYLSRRRVGQEFAAIGITEWRYNDDELDGVPYALVQFNPPAPEPAPIPVSHQIPACVGIAEPGTLAAQRGTGEYESVTLHVTARARSGVLTQAWLRAQRWQETETAKFNVWNHQTVTHSAWVRLPGIQRVECITAKRRLDGVWWYCVDISTDPGQKMLKWYREDVLEGVRRDKADRTMDVERRKYAVAQRPKPAQEVRKAIGQRVHIPAFDAGGGHIATGCDYTIVSIDDNGDVLIKHFDGSEEKRAVGWVYGDMCHHARSADEEAA